MTVRTMSDSDALLWTLGRDPVLRPTVVAVVVLDGAPPWNEVRSRFEALTHLVPQFRSRVVSAPMGWGRPRWVIDDHFDLDIHVRHMVAPPPATLRTVLDLAQSMATFGFDSALAPWEVVLVEGLDGGGAGLVVKFHHAISDGVGGMAAMLELVDRGEHRGLRAPGSPALPPPAHLPGPSALGWPLLASQVARTAAHPAASVRAARATAESVGRLLAPARRPLSPVWSQRGLGRRFEVLDVPASRLHAVARETAMTVNDVFLCAVVGGFRRYHDQHGIALDALRALMPISVRDERDPAMGNRFVPARFVVGAELDPVRRLRRLHEVAQTWKHAPGLALNEVLAAALDALPSWLVTVVWGGLLKGNDFVATNVPGLSFDTSLVGARLQALYAFAPPSGAALNVSLVTMADRACIGVCLDTAAVPDSNVLLEDLSAGFDEVMALGTARPRVA
jgi:WS/DGAT/MGAT family acyltransferase